MSFYVDKQGSVLIYSDHSEGLTWEEVSSIRQKVTEDIIAVVPSPNIVNKIVMSSFAEFIGYSGNYNYLCEEIDLSGFSADGVDVAGYHMIINLQNLKKLKLPSDLKNINVRSTQDSMIWSMAPEELEIDFSGAEMTSMYALFSGGSAKKMSLYNVNATNLSNLQFMFYANNSIEELSMQSIHSAVQISCAQMFQSATKINSIIFPLSDTGISFTECFSRSAADVELLDLDFHNSPVNGCRNMFSRGGLGACAAEKIRFKNFILVDQADCNSMFQYCSDLTTIYATSDFNQNANSYLMFADCPNLVGGAGFTYDPLKTDVRWGKINTAEVEGYLTKYIDPNRTEVIFLTAGSGTATVTEIGTDSYVTIIPNADYIYDYSEIFEPNGRKDTTTSNTEFTVRRMSPGVWKVYAYLHWNDEPSPENPGGGAYPDEINDPTKDIISDTITDDKPSDWYDFGQDMFMTLFTPNKTQLKEFAEYMWDPNLATGVVRGIGSIFNISLKDCIISLRAYPFATTPNGQAQPKIGWFVAASCPFLTLSKYWYKEFNCGTIHIDPVYNSFLDYELDVSIYLPYIGERSLAAYDVLGHDINPIYQIDLATGQCICKIYIDGSCRYQFNGVMGYELPVASSNMENVLSAGLNAAVMASGGLSVKTTSNSVKKGLDVTKRTDVSEQVGAPNGETWNAVNDRSATRITTHKTQSDPIGLFTDIHNGINRIGAVQGVPGYLGIQTPYLTITYPHAVTPQNFGSLNGYPSNRYCKLSTLHGYTEVQAIHLEGLTATEPEIVELDDILKGGIII